MAGLNKTGNLFPQVQRTEYDFDPTRGPIVRQIFDGASQAIMYSLYLDYVRQGIACRLSYELSGRASLEIIDSTQEWVLDSWEFDGDSENVAWLLNPKQFGSWTNVTAAAKAVAKINDYLESNTDRDTAFKDAALSPFVNTTTWLQYPFAQMGATSYDNAGEGIGYVLKHSTNVSNQYTVNIADFNVGEIYTPAQLLSEVSDSGLWINPLSLRGQYKIATLPTPPFRQNWLVGWMKGRSTETTAANNRVDIVTNYRYGQWSLALYNPVTA